MKLGEVVKKYRQEHGLSMREFAKQCNMSRTYILMLEHGVNPKTVRALSPTVETLQRIAAGMGMTLERLTPRLSLKSRWVLPTLWCRGLEHPCVGK